MRLSFIQLLIFLCIAQNINSNSVDNILESDHHFQSVYTSIKQTLDKFNRPFTLLDIGAHNGQYSFRIARDYDSVCVMLEDNAELLNICLLNNVENVILLNKNILFDDLKRLSECEQFDVILALDIQNQFPNNWQEILNILKRMGDLIIIKDPDAQKENRTISTLLLISQEKHSLMRKLWLLPPTNSQDQKHIIHSNYNEKVLEKRILRPINKYLLQQTDKNGNLVASEAFFGSYPMRKITPWIPGINLITFKMLCGSYPTASQMIENFKKLSHTQHSDWVPGNIVVQGKKLSLIDFDDPTLGHREQQQCPQEIFEFVTKLITTNAPSQVQGFFEPKRKDKSKGRKRK